MKPSEVMFKNGSHGPAQGRTSYSAFLNVTDNPVIHCLVERAANVTHTPPDSREALQVVRYYPGQSYDPHYDYSPRESMMNNPYALAVGPRSATFLVYLNDEKDGLNGGETEFSKLKLDVVPKKNSACKLCCALLTC